MALSIAKGTLLAMEAVGVAKYLPNGPTVHL